MAESRTWLACVEAGRLKGLLPVAWLKSMVLLVEAGARVGAGAVPPHPPPRPVGPRLSAMNMDVMEERKPPP